MKRCPVPLGLALAGCFMVSCDTASNSNPVLHDPAGEETGEAIVYLPQIPADFLAKAKQVIQEGKLVLLISGPGMQPIELWWPISAIPDTAVVIKDIPVGIRTFTGRLVSSEGIICHEGDTASPIDPGKVAKVHLKLNYSDNGGAAVCIEIEGLSLPSCALNPTPISGCWDVMIRLHDVKPDRRGLIAVFPVMIESTFSAMLFPRGFTYDSLDFTSNGYPLRGTGNIIRITPHGIEARIELRGQGTRFFYSCSFVPRRFVKGVVLADSVKEIGEFDGSYTGPEDCYPKHCRELEPPSNCKMMTVSLGKCASMQDLVAALKDRCDTGTLFNYWFEKQCGEVQNPDSRFPFYYQILGICCPNTTLPPSQ